MKIYAQIRYRKAVCYVTHCKKNENSLYLDFQFHALVAKTKKKAQLLNLKTPPNYTFVIYSSLLFVFIPKVYFLTCN
jgi:hypothetical protein